ncbi:VanZ family protein [Streptomyces sp. D2-8]|uniref:VanZ family protein n=1 Tax=Streptomyces sp. D2-8 TaxID=2707767 RepID=UPI0020BD7BAE|nr:VanZ family protein [Streptomyces sp. D2-8]MCK8434178.1 VanZ family protein [Streptomyces sp. D2-8]
MIEASVSAVPRLLVSFLILAALLAVPTAFVAKAREKPWPLRTALAVSLAGIVAVTLLPGNAGLEVGQCDTSLSGRAFTSSSSLLNIALFAPGAFLAALLFRRPVTVAAAFGLLSGSVELIQSVAGTGRACTMTDIAANATGAVLGALAGAVWLYQRRQAPRNPVRDLFWGMGIAALSAAAVAGLIHFRIDSVDVATMDDQREDFTQSAIAADDWITATAKGIYGSDVRILESSSEKQGKRLRATVNTNRGSLSGWWPEKDLERAWSSNTRGDEGSLSQNEVAAAADTYARKWIPKNVAGSKQQIRPIGGGATKAYVVSYRRYSEDVLLPMRLDLTVTTTGRVIGFTARTIADPDLPPVTVDEAKARAVAKGATDLPTESALLLAQKINGEWRPVWLVGSGKKDIAIDAATGERIVKAE